MEGTQPSALPIPIQGPAPTQPTPALEPAPLSGRKQLLVVLIVVALVVALISVYILTRPIPLFIDEEFSPYAIQGNLTSYDSSHPLVANFVAWSHAYETDDRESTLGISVNTTTAYWAGPAGHYYDGGYIQTNVAVTIVANFTPNLHPSGIVLMGNETGRDMDGLQFQSRFQTGTNVSFNANQAFGVSGTGSGTATATPVNDGGTGLYYYFSYAAAFILTGYLGHTRFAGFLVTLDGPFTPALSVGIVLAIIDVPA